MSVQTIKLKRTVEAGWNNFRRNGWLTVATVTVFTLSLLITGLTVSFGYATSVFLQNLENKVNITVAFNTDTTETRILQIKQELSKYKEVASIQYISRDQALQEFLKATNNDPNITKALDQIGGNPLPASLVINANQPDQYPIINEALKQSEFQDDIARINYEKNKQIIDTVTTSSQTTKRTGMLLAAIFVLVSLIVAFNTIRINMHSRRQEYEIMRLVGASNTYMRLPSVFEGIFYGLVAAVLSAILLVPAIKLIGSAVLFSINPSFLLAYYIDHWVRILAILLALGGTLGALSGYLALNRYLKI
ncbi:MAG: permease-like cell division protein FtsX [Candidatus Moraniibacteriota bacterium]